MKFQIFTWRKGLRMAKLNVEIPDSLHKALKQKAVDQETTIKEILTDLVKHYVGKQQKDPKKEQSQTP